MSYSVKRLTKAELFELAPGQPAEVGLAAALNSQTQEVVSVQLLNSGDVVLVTRHRPCRKGPQQVA